MTAAQFIAECHARTIDPRIAKENPDLLLALLHDDDAEMATKRAYSVATVKPILRPLI